MRWVWDIIVAEWNYFDFQISNSGSRIWRFLVLADTCWKRMIKIGVTGNSTTIFTRSEWNWANRIEKQSRCTLTKKVTQRDYQHFKFVKLCSCHFWPQTTFFGLRLRLSQKIMEFTQNKQINKKKNYYFVKIFPFTIGLRWDWKPKTSK